MARRALLVSYSSYALGIVSSALLIPMQIRYLGDESYALWSLCFASLSLVTLLEGGLSTAWMRFAAARPSPERWTRGFSTMLAHYLALVLMGLPLVALLSWLLPGWTGQAADLTRPLVWILACRLFLFTLPLSLFRVALHAQQQTVTAQAWASLMQLGYLLGSVGWLRQGGGLLGLALVNLAFALAEHLGYVVLTWRRLGPVAPPWRDYDPQLARDFRSQGVAGLVVQLASLILLKTDPLLVKALLPMQAVAQYAVALKIAENYLMFLKQFLPVLTPRLGAAAASRDPAQLRQLVLQASCWSTLPAVALALPFWWDAEGLLSAWVGEAYRPAANALRILLLAGLLSLPQMVVSSALAMSGQLASNARAALLAVVINPLASLFWAWQVGLPGIALGTLTATVVVDLLVVLRVGSARFDLGLRDWLAAFLRLHLRPALLSVLWLGGTRAWWSHDLAGWCAWAGMGIVFYLLGIWPEMKISVRSAGANPTVGNNSSQ